MEPYGHPPNAPASAQPTALDQLRAHLSRESAVVAVIAARELSLLPPVGLHREQFARQASEQFAREGFDWLVMYYGSKNLFLCWRVSVVDSMASLRP